MRVCANEIEILDEHGQVLTSASMRKVADFPTPDVAGQEREPPSPMSCSTRRQKDSIRGVRCRPSTGIPAEKGLCRVFLA